MPELPVKCKANPEIIKYQPSGSLLAVQCNDGSVSQVFPSAFSRVLIDEISSLCLLRNGTLSFKGSTLRVAPPEKNHITADMVWGVGATEGRIFASSACPADGTGNHKAFDINTQKCVLIYDANEQACSTLSLDASGELATLPPMPTTDFL